MWTLAIVVLLAPASFAQPGLLAEARGTATDKKDGTKLTEAQKIDSLIATVRDLKDATFIRNGREYDCKDAARHMERKRKAAGKRIKTAAEFIRHAASKSSHSGKPYLIRFKDGKEETSEAFLMAELAKLEGKAPDDAEPPPESKGV